MKCSSASENKVVFRVSAADLVLWRDKHTSGSILAGVTVVWLLFEGIGYHLLTFLCHSLIVFLTVCFVWSNAASFINRSFPLLLLYSSSTAYTSY
jgi:hypothetical protein